MGSVCPDRLRRSDPRFLGIAEQLDRVAGNSRRHQPKGPLLEKSCAYTPNHAGVILSAIRAPGIGGAHIQEPLTTTRFESSAQKPARVSASATTFMRLSKSKARAVGGAISHAVLMRPARRLAAP